MACGSTPATSARAGKVEEVVRGLRERAVPIRIGVNGGSLERELLERYGHPTPAAMVESALGHIRLLGGFGL
jgi:(E)-4-hydroxy-3-methylbut-2-enyl-diphosphate synthase